MTIKNVKILLQKIVTGKLTKYQIQVLIAIILHGREMPTLTRISEMTGIKRHNVARAKSQLISSGVLSLDVVSTQIPVGGISTDSGVSPQIPPVTPFPKNPFPFPPLKEKHIKRKVPPVVNWPELKNKINSLAEPPYFPTVRSINSTQLAKLKVRIKDDPEFLNRCWQAIPVCIAYRKADTLHNFSWLDGFWKFLGNNKDGEPILDKILARSYDHMLPREKPKDPSRRKQPPVWKSPEEEQGEVFTADHWKKLKDQAAGK